MIGQSRKGLASFHASVSFWCLSSLKIGRKNGAVSLILVSFVLNYKCSDFLCQSAFIYKKRRTKTRRIFQFLRVLNSNIATGTMTEKQIGIIALWLAWPLLLFLSEYLPLRPWVHVCFLKIQQTIPIHFARNWLCQNSILGRSAKQELKQQYRTLCNW